MENIEALLEEHGHGVLCFSAGKDSLACLEMLRPWLEKITLVWVDGGAAHEMTYSYMQEVAASVPHFQVVRGNQPRSIEQYGWPADVLPVRGTLAGSYGSGPRPTMFQPYTECCGRSMWSPLAHFLKLSGHSLVITGQRKDEPLRNRMRDEVLQTVEGVTYLQPLNDWTSVEVWYYLTQLGVKPPPFYAEGAESSSDCWNCTAYLDHNQGRLAWMRQAEPLRYRTIRLVLTELQSQLREDGAALDKLLENSDGNV